MAPKGSNTVHDESSRMDKPDIMTIMAEIRTRVKDRVKDGEAVDSPFKITSSAKSEGLIHSEELRYINMNCTYSLSWIASEKFSSHRPILGSFIVGVKTLGAKIVAKFLRGYFDREREYQAHLVRHLNDVSKELNTLRDFLASQEAQINQLEGEVARLGKELSRSNLK